MTDVPARLRSAVMRLARVLRQQAEGDVTASLLSALGTVDRDGPITLGQLAAAEKLQPPSMTKIVARLDELGYVTRTVDDRDRRVARVDLTKEGRDYIAANRRRRDLLLARRLRTFTEQEQATLAAAVPLLERLVEAE